MLSILERAGQLLVLKRRASENHKVGGGRVRVSKGDCGVEDVSGRVQGASAFKVAALGSHSSPSPSSQNHACFSLCASCISAFLPRISSRVISFPSPSTPRPLVSLRKEVVFSCIGYETCLSCDNVGIFFLRNFSWIPWMWIYIYIFIERLDRKYRVDRIWMRLVKFERITKEDEMDNHV